MPIEFKIDSGLRLVLARGHGTLTHQDVIGYQREVWSRRDVAGFDELMDMSAVEGIALASTEQIRQLAQLSASMDASTGSAKFAIVAPQHLAFGLGRMYQTYRGLEDQSTKEVGVFRTMDEALAFLGLAGDSSKAG